MILSPSELVSEEKNTHKFIKQGYINRKNQCSLPALCLFAIVNTYSSSCQLTGSHYQRIQFCFWFLSQELFNHPPTNIGAVIVSNTLKCLIIEWLGTFNNCTEQGCISCGMCSYPELTKDHVLTSAYVNIFRTVEMP